MAHRSLLTSLLLASALGASGCGMAGDLDGGDVAGSGGSTSSGPGAASGMGGAGGLVEVDPEQTEPPDGYSLSALCGMGACDPADPSSCGSGGASSGGAGSGGAGGGAVGPLGCQLASDAGLATPVCGPVGVSGAEQACLSASDCALGLGCVAVELGGEGGAPGAGLCRPYCCGSAEECPASTHCAAQPLLADREVRVPVCAPVEPCPLLTEGACPEGLVCSVVRADGTTSCVEPGAGGLCDPCPCAEGFVCSVGTGTCQALCRTDQPDACPGGGACQGGGALPEGIGVCFGGDAMCSE